LSKKKTAIVTGGAGFIGSHMVDLLLDYDYEVRAIDNFAGGHLKNINHLKNVSNFFLIEKDIREISEEDLSFKDVDVIFHFAGLGDIVPSIDFPYKYFDVNVQGTVNLLNCSKKNKINNFIYAASSSCYGLADYPTKETNIINPQYPYAMSKYMGELAVMHWKKVYRMNNKSIRIFNAYGRRVRTTGVYGAVFGVFLKQKLEGKNLTVVGDGNQKRDFLHVKDVARAFFKVFEENTNDCIFNVGAGNPRSILELIKLLESEYEFIPKRPGEPDVTWADISKINEQTGWIPTISFEDGVKEMVDNIKEWQDAPLWDKSNIEKATKTWFDYLK
tara:strand:+ start:8245 stop:9237 length:993 start_codon:yes stop_codon:yes gene_type:complete